MQTQAGITCWDVIAGRQCPRGLKCKYCQEDKEVQAKENAVSVSLYEFSEEYKSLEDSELTQRLKMELEAFGELSDFQLKSDIKHLRVAIASYTDPESIEHAMEALANPNFEIPFTIVPGKMSVTAPPKASLQKPTIRSKVTVYIDELEMKKRPAAHAIATDCEVFIKGLPPESVYLSTWLERFGAIQDSFRIPNRVGQTLNRGYVRFNSHEAAEACVKAGVGSWSESERALDWQGGPNSYSLSANTYPYSVAFALVGEDHVEIEKLRLACGLSELKVEGADEKSAGKRLHFVAAGVPSAVAKVRSNLEKRLAEIHEDIANILKEGSSHATATFSSTIVHIDELCMPDRPVLNAAEKDREVWVPQAPRRNEDMKAWSCKFGEIEDVYPITLPGLAAESSENKGYVRFRSHDSAKRCVDAGIGTWSESERALSWEGLGQPLRKKLHTYPISIVSFFIQNNAESMKDVAKCCGALSVTMGGENVSQNPVSKRLHFVAEGVPGSCMKTLVVELEKKLAQVHTNIRNMLAHEALKNQWMKHVTVDEKSSAIQTEPDQRHRERENANDKKEKKKEKRRDRRAASSKQNPTHGNEDRSDEPAEHNPYLGAYVSSPVDLGREAKRARPSARPSSAPCPSEFR